MPFDPFAEKSFKESGIKKKKPTTTTPAIPTSQVTYPAKAETDNDKWGRWLKSWSDEKQQETTNVGSPEWWENIDEYPEEVKKFNTVEITPPSEVKVQSPENPIPETPFETGIRVNEPMDLEAHRRPFKTWLSNIGYSFVNSIFPSEIMTSDAPDIKKTEMLLKYLGGDWSEGLFINEIQPVTLPEKAFLKGLRENTVFQGLTQEATYIGKNVLGSRLVNAALSGLSLLTRYAGGLAKEFGQTGRGGAATEEVIPGVSNKQSKLIHLLDNDYADYVKSLPQQPLTSDSEYTTAVQASIAAQKEFNETYYALTGVYPKKGMERITLPSGNTYFQPESWSEQDAADAALDCALKVEENMMATANKILPKEWFTATKTAENPLGAIPEVLEALNAAKGHRYSHDVDSANFILSESSKVSEFELGNFIDRENEYYALLDSGMSAVQAGNMTEDPFTENLYLTVFDPSWLMGNSDPGQLFIESLWKGGVKPVAKGIGWVAKRTPVVKKLVAIAMDKTMSTVTTHAYKHTVVAIKGCVAKITSDGGEVTPENIIRMMQDDVVVATLPVAQRRAIMEIRPYIDEFAETLKRRLSDTNIEVLAKKIVNWNTAKGVTEADAVVLAKAQYAATLDAANASARKVFDATKAAYLETHKLTNLLYTSSVGKVIRKVDNFVSGIRGFMVDTWLGRPSWLEFNYADNSLKLLLTGVDPTSSVPALLERYAKYAGSTTSSRVLEIAAEMRTLKKGKNIWETFKNLFKTSVNEQYTKLLNEALESDIPGTFGLGNVGERTLGQALASSDVTGMLRNLPGRKQWLDFMNSWASRIERDAHVRVFMSAYFKRIDEGMALLKAEPVKALVSGILKEVSPEVNQTFLAKLSAIADPTVNDIQNIITEIMDEKLVTTTPDLVSDLGSGTHRIPVDILPEIQGGLNRIATEAATTGTTTKSVNVMFDNIAKKLYDKANDIETVGLRAVDSGVQAMPATADDMVKMLLPEGKVGVVTPAIKPQTYQEAITSFHKKVSELPPVKEGYVRVYRASGVTNPNAPQISWLDQFTEENKIISGRWYGNEVGADFYIADAWTERGVNITYLDLPKSIYDEILNAPEVTRWSRTKVGEEVFLPRELQQAGIPIDLTTPEVTKMSNPNLTELYQAMVDVKQFGIRAKIDDSLAKINFFKKLAELKKAKAGEAAYTAAFDQFYQVERPAMWNKVEAMQREAYEKLGQQAQELVSGVTKPVSEAAQPVVENIPTKPINMAESPILEKGTKLQHTSIGDVTVVRTHKIKDTRISGGYATVYDIVDVDGKVHKNIRSFWLKNVEVSIEPISQVVQPVINPIKKYTDAIVDANHTKTVAMLDINNEWKLLRRDKLNWEKSEFDEVWAITSPETYLKWTNAKFTADDIIEQNCREIRKWFEDNGVVLNKNAGGLPYSVDTGWWRLEQQVDDIPVSMDRELQAQLEELNSMRKDVLNNRLKPKDSVRVKPEDAETLNAYGNVASTRIRNITDAAYDYAIDTKNNLLFDYGTTSNWMAWLGKISPFVRFPTKNIPLWLDKFSEIPHLASSVYWARMLQSAHNEAKYGPNMPESLRYTSEIPFSGKLMQALGLGDSALRVNFWVYFSFVQQIPGASAFEGRQLAELTSDPENNQTAKNVQSVTTIAESLGLGMWPGIEYALGSLGLLGQSWYPHSFLGTNAAFWAWVSNVIVLPAAYKAGGMDFSQKDTVDVSFVDKATRSFWIGIWNYLYKGRPDKQWQTMNVDLFKNQATGREMVTLASQLADPVVAALADMTPTQADDIVNKMDETTYASYLPKIDSIFKMDETQQIQIVETLTQEDKAVLLHEIDLRAQRLAIWKNLITTYVGHTTGLYGSAMDESYIDLANLRQKRKELEQKYPAGAERRSAKEQFDTDHPLIDYLYTHVYSKYPWAETNAGLTAERIDSLTSDYKELWYEYNTEFYNKMDAVVGDYYKQHPGDAQGVKALRARLYTQKDEYLKTLNTELNAKIQSSIEDFRREYPEDTKGLNQLLNGFEEAVYVAPQLTDEARQQLAEFAEIAPEDQIGYSRLFQQLIAETPTQNTQMKWIPGFSGEYNVDVKWSPVDNPNYSEEEIRKFVTGDVLQELYDNRPVQDGAKTTDEFYAESQAYMANLPELAMQTEEAKKQVQQLVNNAGMSEEEATKTVSSWYTSDELYAQWRENDNMWDALEYVYQWHVITPANTEFYDVILPERAVDYAKYSAMKEDFDSRMSQTDARDLIKFIMQDYPGKWTVNELENAFEGITMPSFFEKQLLTRSGEKAVDAYIWDYYGNLDADQKRLVRDSFGKEFSDIFLEGDTDKLSLELRGSWYDALAGMFGEEKSWMDLPGIDNDLQNTTARKEAVDYGLPNVPTKDMAEFNQAKDINRQYWEAVVNNDETSVKSLKYNELRLKWFGNSDAGSYMWNFYYTVIPPGSFASDLKTTPLVKAVLDVDSKEVVGTNSVYDKVLTVMMQWYEENKEAIIDADLNPDEYDEARELIKEYYAIPEEDKASRKAFKAANPLLKKYLDAGYATSIGSSTAAGGVTTKKTTTKRTYSGGGGGSESSAPKITYREAWATLKTEVGQSFSAVLRMLIRYWNDGAFGAGSETYLRNLYSKLGASVSFEEWLNLLRKAWLNNASSSGGFNAVSEPKAPPEPEYNTRGSSGIRRS